ncbi:MAG: 1-(5-phosphoribosyl)-5-amino-4-imidazole-carboxylate carboxylase [Deltaproteobacteria bacterium]|nr:1-(5-phosphoribosyl)-5-amino-4-imidazole-carboxylate carboxylase [Deltaproteobacteria bacterium]
MTEDGIQNLLTRVQAGELSVEIAREELSRLPFVETKSARVDTHRALRQGIPEVIFGLGKTPDQVSEVIRVLQAEGQNVLVTRLEPEAAEAVQALVGPGHYEPLSRLFYMGAEEVEIVGKGKIGIVCAGTADLPVALEAEGVARRFGNEVDVIKDVGVAGIHRLLACQDRLREARVLIVVAGMEGALPSVVGGMVDKPVIAVPTSIGYGASMGGLAALLGMLTSCVSNVTVVNIDNGFGAAYAATLINRL